MKIIQNILLTVILIIFMATTTKLAAQTSISATDILALKGTSRSFLSSFEDTLIVSIGSGGINQIWDFSTLNPTMFLQGTLEYKEPAGGYQAELFPEANIRQKMSASTEEGSFLIESYMNISSDTYRTLGSASDFAGFSFLEIENDDVAPLPMIFGTTWISQSADTSSQIGFVTITTDISFNKIDGSGTLKLPMGDFECLRLRDKSISITSSTFNGESFGEPDTTESVSFTWLSKFHLQTISVDSLENGMGEVSFMLSGEATSAEVYSNKNPQSFNLDQNYPNPFNPTTSISFLIPYAGNVELAIHDILGNKVSVLENGYKSAGIYSYQFDASKLTSGIYFYSIKAGNFSSTKKMLLMK